MTSNIYRDTIHIEGVKLGFDRLALFDRHAVGGNMAQGGKVLDWTLMKRRSRDLGLDLESKK